MKLKIEMLQFINKLQKEEEIELWKKENSILLKKKKKKI